MKALLLKMLRINPNRMIFIIQYNRYGDHFLIDKTKQADEIEAELVGISEVTPDREWQIIKNDDYFRQKDQSNPELEMDLEQCETEKKEQKNLRTFK